MSEQTDENNPMLFGHRLREERENGGPPLPPSQNTLAPCPFCGSIKATLLPPTCRPETPYNAADRLYPVVRCADCRVDVPGKNEDYKGNTAVTAWNTRAPCPQEWTAKCHEGIWSVLHSEGVVILNVGEVNAKRLRDLHNASVAPCPIKDEGEETKELGKPEAPSDNVEHVLQKALSLLQAAEDDALTCVERPTEASAIHTYNAVQAVTSVLKGIASGTLPVTPTKLTPKTSPATTGKGPMTDLELPEAKADNVSAVLQKELELHSWLSSKLAEAESALRAREQMESTFRSGTDESWAKAADMHPETAGKPMSKRERVKAAESQGRIAVKCRRDVEMFQTLLAGLPSEGRATDEQGGLPVTPNSSSPALPLPLSEETTEDELRKLAFESGVAVGKAFEGITEPSADIEKVQGLMSWDAFNEFLDRPDVREAILGSPSSPSPLVSVEETKASGDKGSAPESTRVLQNFHPEFCVDCGASRDEPHDPHCPEWPNNTSLEQI